MVRVGVVRTRADSHHLCGIAIDFRKKTVCAIDYAKALKLEPSYQGGGKLPHHASIEFQLH